MKGIIAAIIVFSILLTGCSQPPIGGQKDEHGCLIAAGYSWCDASQKCIRAWEENCTEIKACTQEAKLCPDGSAVGRVGPNCEFAPCPENNIVGNDTDAYGCKTSAGYSWCESSQKCIRAWEENCTAESCSGLNGNNMTLQDAVAIAKASVCGDNLIIDCSCPVGFVKEGDSCNPECSYAKPPCMRPSIQCEKSYVCNEGTGTYWINMNITRQGCSPACVVDIGNSTAEINWRCTGLIQP